MWPFKKSSQPNKTVLISSGHSDYIRTVSCINGRLAVWLFDSVYFIQKSNNGFMAKATKQDGTSRTCVPYTGWTDAELREYGFEVKDDQMLHEEIMLAKAVMDGDKAAAGALADWVMEYWGTPKNPK